MTSVNRPTDATLPDGQQESAFDRVMRRNSEQPISDLSSESTSSMQSAADRHAAAQSPGPLIGQVSVARLDLGEMDRDVRNKVVEARMFWLADRMVGIHGKAIPNGDTRRASSELAEYIRGVAVRGQGLTPEDRENAVAIVNRIPQLEESERADLIHAIRNDPAMLGMIYNAAQDVQGTAPNLMEASALSADTLDELRRLQQARKQQAYARETQRLLLENVPTDVGRQIVGRSVASTASMLGTMGQAINMLPTVEDAQFGDGTTVNDAFFQFSDALREGVQAANRTPGRDYGIPNIVPERVEGWIGGATESLMMVMSGSVLTGGQPIGPIAVFTASAMSSAEREASAAGMEGPAKLNYVLEQGAAEAVITSAFQIVGLGGLEQLRNPFKQGLLSGLKRHGIDQASEITEEIVVDLTQRTSSYMRGVDPEAFDADRITNDMIDLVGQTVIAVGGKDAPGLFVEFTRSAVGERRAEGEPKAPDTATIPGEVVRNQAERAEQQADDELADIEAIDREPSVAEQAREATPDERQEAVDELTKALTDAMEASQRGEQPSLTPDEMAELEQLRSTIQQVDQQSPKADLDEGTQREFTSRNRETKQTKALLDRIRGVRTEEGTIKPSEVLRVRLRSEEVGSRVTDRSARQQERAKSRQRIAEIREEFRQKTRTLRKLRDELADEIQNRLPKNRQADLLRRVERVRGRQSFQNVLEKVMEIEQEVIDQDKRESLKKTLDLVEKQNPRTFSQSIRSRVEDLIATISRDRISKNQRQALERLAIAQQAGKMNRPLSPKEEQGIADIQKRAVDDLDAEEAELIDEALTSLLAQEQLKKKITVRRRARDRSRVVQAIADQLRSRLRGRRVSSERGDKQEGESRPSLLNLSFGEVENTIAMSLFKQFGPEAHDVFYGDMDRGNDAAKQSYKTEFDWVSNELLPSFGITKQEGARMSAVWGRERSIFERMAGREATSHRIHRHTLESGEDVAMTEAQEAGILAMLRDSQIRQQVLFDGRPIVMSQEAAGVKHQFTFRDFDALTQRLRDEGRFDRVDGIAREVFDRVNSPHIRDRMRDFFLRYFGVDRTRPGDYFPSIARPEKGDPSEQIARDLLSTSEAAPTSVGIAKQREQAPKAPLEVRDIFLTFHNYAWTASHLVELGPAIINARDVVTSNRVKTILSNTRVGNRLRNRIQNIYRSKTVDITGRTGPISNHEQGFSNFFRRVGRGILGNNFQIASYQISSISLAPHSGLVNEAEILLGIPRAFDFTIDKHIDMDGFMWDRNRSGGTQFVIEGAATAQKLFGRGGMEGEWALWAIRTVDRAALRIIWSAARVRAQAMGMRGAEAQAEATRRLREIVKISQPSRDPLHTSGLAVEARTRRALGLFTFFRSQTSKMVSMVHEDTRRFLDNKSIANFARLMRTIGRIMFNTSLVVALGDTFRSTLLAFGAAMAGRDFGERFLAESIIAAMADSDDEEAEKARAEFGSQVVGRTFGLWPILGSGFGFATTIVSEAAGGERGFEPVNPAEGMIVRGAQSSGQAGKELARAALDEGFDSDRFWKNAVDAAGVLTSITGLPLMAPIRDVRRVMTGMEEESRGSSPLLR